MAIPIDIGIGDKDRAAIAAGLSQLLADTYTLYLTTHNFHWNVDRADVQHAPRDVHDAVHRAVERGRPDRRTHPRARAIPAPGSYAQFGALSALPDVPATPPKALEMVGILVQGHQAVARTARAVFPLAAEADDEPTADLLTQRLDIHEQTAWMLRSLLEE